MRNALMKRRLYLHALALLAAAACSSPAKPTTSLTSPRLLEPGSGVLIAHAQQPVTLVIQNAATTGSTPLTYLFEVASDERFGTIVFSRDNVAQGSGGRTSVTLPDPLPGAKTYWWRAQAKDGGTAGPAAAPARFQIGEPARIDPPVMVSPAQGATVSEARPRFTVNNSARSGPVGDVSYTFEVAENDSFSPTLASDVIAEQPTQTSFVPDRDLPGERSLYWRVRAGDGKVNSPWAGPSPFRVELGIDLRTAIFVKGPNVAGWAETSRITSVSIGNGQICVNHTMLGRWPTIPFFDDPSTQVEGNFNFCANTKYMANGDGRDQWYCAAAFWNRPGQGCKSEDANSLRDTWYQPNEEPMHSWIPRPGEPFGIYMTTPSRNWPAMRSTDERTNVVLMKWPG